MRKGSKSEKGKKKNTTGKSEKRKKRLKIGIAVVAVLIVLSMFTGSDDSKLNMPVASQEYIGEDYQAVASGLEELGFSNVVVEPIEATTSDSQKQF